MFIGKIDEEGEKVKGENEMENEGEEEGKEEQEEGEEKGQEEGQDEEHVPDSDGLPTVGAKPKFKDVHFDHLDISDAIYALLKLTVSLLLYSIY